MTNQEIDFKLALAIGYAPDRVRTYTGFWEAPEVQVLNDFSRCDGLVKNSKGAWQGWQRFDHKDPAVIWPIAERFNCFPYLLGKHKPSRVWNAFVDCHSENSSKRAATATALVVIKHCKKGKV